jgi:hypothetical protein
MNSFPMKYSQAIPLLRQVLPPVLGIELKSLSILGKHFTIELHPQPKDLLIINLSVSYQAFITYT